MQMKRISEREAILERENGLLRALLTSDPSTMRHNIESMWANIERMERENAALWTLLEEVMPLLHPWHRLYINVKKQKLLSSKELP